VRPLVFFGLLTWLVFLFSTLGISASDFFTPNLATIAQLLGLDENVAGVTFLALGNGSPDVFSTFSAMRANSGGLAVGELLGAATFIVSCVVGSMCIIKPFKVNRGHFLRDVGFFTLAVALLVGILSDHRIHAWEAGLLVGVYIVYVFVVIISSWWDGRQERKRHIENLIRSEYAPADIATQPYFEEPYRDDRKHHPLAIDLLSTDVYAASTSNLAASSLARVGDPRLDIRTNHSPQRHSTMPPVSPTHRLVQMPSFSLLGALEFRQVVASLQHQAAGSSLDMFESSHAPYAGGHYRSRTISTSRPRSGTQSDPWDAALGVPLHDRSPPQLRITHALFDEPEEIHHGIEESAHSDSSVSHTSAPTISDSDAESQQGLPLTWWRLILSTFTLAFGTLCPSLHHFRSKSLLGKVVSIFAVPAVMALTLTLPVVVIPYESHHISREKAFAGEGRLIDFEEEGIERALIAEEEVQEELHELAFNKWLMAVQCICGPLFCVGVLFSACDLNGGQSADLTFFAGGSDNHLWLLIAAAIGGFALAILVLVFADKGDHVVSRMARSSMGFLVAIVWIMAIADEVVIVLQACIDFFRLLTITQSIITDIWIYIWVIRCYHWSDHLCHWQLSC
jgi:solute carrier family 24 (sodium/potassium/calcium exchanger), member 6